MSYGAAVWGCCPGWDLSGAETVAASVDRDGPAAKLNGSKVAFY